MLNITVRQMRAVQIIAGHGSFVAAARELNVTAAALSAMTREFEIAVGFRMFDRTTRSLKITAAGMEFLPYIQRVLGDLERAEQFVAAQRLHHRSSVRIASTQFIACTVLPPLFQAFRATTPDARMQLIDSAIDDVVETVRNGSADLGLYLDVGPDEVLGSVPLCRVPLCVVVHATDPIASMPEVRWTHLSDRKIIYMGREDTLRRNLEEADLDLKFPSVRVEHGTSALALVSAGEGIAIMTSYVRPMLSIYGLRMIPLVEPTLSRQIVLLTNKKRALPRVAARFMDFAQAALIDTFS